jgi:hypothetical protein
MTLLYAIDPGAKASTGKASYLARFDAGELVAVSAVTWASVRNGWHEQPAILVIEKPQQDRRSAKVPPATLIELAWRGALIAGALRPLRIVEYEPAEWKGQTPKPAHHWKAWQVLTHRERLCFPEDTEERIRKGKEATARAGDGKLKSYSFEAANLLDAAALGLFHLGRIGKGGGALREAARPRVTSFKELAGR